ncbi:MAG: alpha/beta fold hydrolase [Balneolales bacterium]|nr:alpha/beta fold hydrolase [Balneolales bacterium]
MEYRSLIHLIRLQGMQYFVREFRPVSPNPNHGETLLMLHGFAGSSSGFLHLLPGISRHGIKRILIPDLAGHGQTRCFHQSPVYRYGSQAQQNDLLNILQLLGVHHLHVYGYSMGGRLALQLGLQIDKEAKTAQSHFPALHSLVLESASPGIQTESDRKIRRESDLQLIENIENHFDRFCSEWDNKAVFDTPTKPTAALQHKNLSIRKSQRPKDLGSSLRAFGTGQMPPVWDELKNLAVPLTLITGEADHKFTSIAQKMIKTLDSIQNTQANHRIISGCGHRIHLEKPDVIADYLSHLRSSG